LPPIGLSAKSLVGPAPLGVRAGALSGQFGASASKQISQYKEDYCLTVVSDGATVHHISLTNLLAVVCTFVVLLEVVDWPVNIAGGSKKITPRYQKHDRSYGAAIHIGRKCRYFGRNSLQPPVIPRQVFPGRACGDHISFRRWEN